MSWEPIANTVPQYFASGVEANGYYLKFYQSGTTTPTSMATDSTGGTTLVKCQINSDGYPINGSSAVFIPHIDQTYKLALYTNSTDADANTFGNAVWVIDTMSTSEQAFTDTGSSVVTTVDARLKETARKFATVAAMTADANAGIGQISMCYDYASGNDAGIMFFEGVAPATGTADGGSYIDHDTLSVQYKRKFEEVISVKHFGAVGDGVTDDTAAILGTTNASSYVTAPTGTYLVDQLPNIGSTDYVGLGTVNINIASDSAISNDNMVKLMSDSKYTDINFTSLISTQDSQRGAIDDSADIFLQRCSFNDFIDTGVGNAWGNLIQRSSRITIDQCSYSNNTQADIALTDDCFDINIFNPKNTTDSGVYLNVEPNSGIGVRGMNVIGGHYRQIDLLENDNTVYSSQNIVVQGARIDVLRYDGSGAVFQNCQIASIIPEPASLTNIFAGQLMIDSCSLRQNLLVDEHVFDVSPSDANSYWTITNTGTVAHKRVNDSVHGKYAQINPDNEAQSVIISTRTNIAVTAGENLMVFMRGRMNNTGTGTNQVDNIVLQWFDTGASLIQNTIVKVNRGPVNVAGGWTNDVAIVQAPALATHVKFRMTNSFASTYVGELDIASVGLFRFDLDQTAQGLGDMPEVIGALSKPVTQKDYIRSDTFLGTNQGYGGMFVGERIIRETPVVGSPKAWSCTVIASSVGLAGTIVSEGNL